MKRIENRKREKRKKVENEHRRTNVIEAKPKEQREDEAEQ